MLTGPPLHTPVADLAGMVTTVANSRPDDVAIVSANLRLSYRELDRAIGSWSAVLVGRGLRPGDRVASLLPNRIALVVHYLACVRSGLVAVPLNYRYVGTQVDHALQVSGARLLFGHSERAGDLRDRDAVVGLPLGCLWYGHAARPDDLADGMTMASRGPERPGDPGRVRPVRAPRGRPGGSSGDSDDDPALIFFTSGSTGPAKGVVHSLRTAGAMVAIAAAAFELRRDDVFLPASSMSHLGAFLWSLATLSVGGVVVVAATFDGDELLPLIRRHRPTVMAMIPAALTALVRDHGATREDFASLRLCRSGSDHVSAALDSEFEALTGFLIDEGYGMSEVGLATLNPPSGVIRPGSIGVPVPGTEVELRDHAGVEVPPDTVGRIHIRSPGATIGYWDAPAATEELFRGDWVDSGDLATADRDGYLWFSGRAKQVIVHDGSNISPQEVEDALSGHPAVAQVGVVGIHDVVHGENVRAYVVLAEGVDPPTTQELVRFARSRVGYRAPEEVCHLDHLPLNPTGKLDRVRLRQMAEDHVFGDR